jgi:hypothetical protein
MIPKAVTELGSATTYSFATLITTIGLTIEVLGGIISGNAEMKTYEYTGADNNKVYPKENWVGPEHTAKYNFHASSTDFNGDKLKSRQITLPACYADRQNWFGGIQQIYTPTIDASISLCVMGFCADLVNGFVLPWNAK